MYVDTHTHLYLPDFGSECGGAVERALEAGVGKMIFPNVDLSTIGQMKSLHESFPDCTYMAMGLHPTEVDDGWKAVYATIERELRDNSSSYVAVGEIGLDLYWDKTYLLQQRDAFRIQAELAVELDKPVIIHCRDAHEEIIGILSDMDRCPRGVFHSFGGSAEDVRAFRETGDFYFGINGIVTFKNTSLREVLPEIGIERIILETDSPYLSPVPYRGKRNESANIPLIAETIANTMGLTIEQVATVTTENAEKLFAITD
ncbi:MAG: TatD family hydrolase [Muribaculaceae bacterium]|nr:TatD family hydrolase [Muribaculaceae bacterium]